jgi:hypothetical protein
MKLRLSKITLSFTLVGLTFALVQVGLSMLYGASDNLVTKEHISNVVQELWFTCPFVSGEIGMDSDRIPSDWALFFVTMTGLNVALYFVVGLICSILINNMRRVIADRPR